MANVRNKSDREKSAKIRNDARRSFLHYVLEGKSFAKARDAVAEEIGFSPSTIQDWRNTYKWDEYVKAETNRIADTVVTEEILRREKAHQYREVDDKAPIHDQYEQALKEEQQDIEVQTYESIQKRRKRLAVASDDEIIDLKRSYLTMLNNMVTKALEDFNEGKFFIERPRDLIEVMKMAQLLMGEPTEKVQVDETHKIKFDHEIMRDVIEKTNSSVVLDLPPDAVVIPKTDDNKEDDYSDE